VADATASSNDITATDSVDSGNTDSGAATPHWIFGKIISGTVYTDEGVTNAGLNKTVRILVNGVSKGTVETDAAGAYSYQTPLNSGDTILIYVDDEGALNGTTITVSDGADLAGLNIFQNHLVLRHDNAGSLSNININTADGTYTDTGGETDDILFSIDGSNNLTVSANTELYIPATHSYAPSANIITPSMENLGTFTGAAASLDVNGNLVLTSGSFTAPSSTINLSGNFTYTAGSFTHNSGTIIFDGAADQSFVTGDQIFNALTINNSGAAANDSVIVNGVLDVNGSLTISDGDLDISSNSPAVNTAGDVNIADGASIDVSARVAATMWTFDGTSILTDNNTGANPIQDLEDVTVDGAGASLTLASSTKVRTLSIGADDSIDLAAGAFTLDIDGTGTPLSVSGTFTAGTSTVQYSGDNFDTNIAVLAYSSLRLAPPTNPTNYLLSGNLSAGNALTADLTIAANATLDASLANNYNLSAVNLNIDASATYLARASTITLSGNWSNSGSFTADTSSVVFNGTGQSISGTTTFNHFTKSVVAADTLTFEATKTQSFNGTVTLNGAAAQLLSLRSSIATTQWGFDLNASATKTISYVDVQDSDASASDSSFLPILPSNSTNSNNNKNWFNAVALSGTVTDDAETDIRSGGSTIILTLTDDTWVAAGATFDAQRQNIINGIDSAQAEAAGWDAVVKAGIAVGDVVRTSNTVVTITLPAFAGYDITAIETITASIPASALSDSSVNLVASPTFNVSVSAGSVALSGTVTDDSETEIRTGGSTIILTLTDDTWVAAGATFDAQRQNVINGIDSAQA
ncbi:MAG: hypothetical protein OEZ58_22995, partial [Gammaproteobacteria bacterium]|nr:hypothetical protein [Gammaproteobacteria bacterium]